MQKLHAIVLWLIVLSMGGMTNLLAQGPPITADKPIMLSSGTILFKTLTEVRSTNQTTMTIAPIMVHYLPTSNTLASVHIPIEWAGNEEQALGLGDLELMLKYQFFRKDGMGKTLRAVLKNLQTFPTGDARDEHAFVSGKYQNYSAVVLGYESIRFGISNELGVKIINGSDRNELRYKLGFGLPLLKPSYPVNQINLYFEYQTSWFYQMDEYELLYAQGIQYAKNRWTIETAIQFPLKHSFNQEEARKHSLFFGLRYVI